jgi:hypothetical protein
VSTKNTTKTAEKNPNEFILKGVRLSFPHLFEPHAIGKDGTPRYTASFLLDPNDPEQKPQIQALRAKANALYAEGTKKPGVKCPSANCAIKKGNDEDGVPRYDGYDGMWFVSAARAKKQGAPLVVDRDKVTKLKDDDTKLFAGCYVNAKIRLYYQDYDGVKRINASLEVVQYFKKGEPFGAGQVAADDMPDVDDNDEDGLDDSHTGAASDDDDDL